MARFPVPTTRPTPPQVFRCVRGTNTAGRETAQMPGVWATTTRKPAASKRTKQLDVAVDQGRNHHLRIDRPVRIGELIALFEVQKAVLPRDALQVQRDAHAKTRLRAVICVE